MVFKELIFNLIGLILILIGVVLIFDARIITQKIFSFGDQNEGSKTLKIIGFLLSIIGAGLIIFL